MPCMTCHTSKHILRSIKIDSREREVCTPCLKQMKEAGEEAEAATKAEAKRRTELHAKTCASCRQAPIDVSMFYIDRDCFKLCADCKSQAIGVITDRVVAAGELFKYYTRGGTKAGVGLFEYVSK